jgi:hypothetical protein
VRVPGSPSPICHVGIKAGTAAAHTGKRGLGQSVAGYSFAEEHNLASFDLAKILCIDHSSKLTASWWHTELDSKWASLISRLADSMAQAVYVWVDATMK